MMAKRRLRFKINASILATAAILGAFLTAFLYPYQERYQSNRLEEIRVLLSAVYDQRREDLANEIFAQQTEALTASSKPCWRFPE